jgi:hypothetical protein
MRIRQEPIGERYIEFAHHPPPLPGSEPRPKKPIRAIPFPQNARCCVTIDGKPYAGFVNKSSAQDAIDLWRGKVDGLGRRVTKFFGAHWPAIEGRELAIVDLDRGWGSS